MSKCLSVKTTKGLSAVQPVDIFTEQKKFCDLPSMKYEIIIRFVTLMVGQYSSWLA